MLNEKVNAGVVVDVATLVVNKGDNVPAEKLVTVPPAVGAAHDAVVPLLVRTNVLLPIARLPYVLEPVPRIKPPVAVAGARALNAAEAVVCPVPPDPISTVPNAGAPVLPVKLPKAVWAAAFDKENASAWAVIEDVKSGDRLPVLLTVVDGRSAATIELNDGAVVEPVALPKYVCAAALLNEKVNAGVLVAVATLVVKRGDRLPAENDVTVPAVAGACQDAVVPLLVRTVRLLPIARLPYVLEPVPRIRPPVAVAGASALNAAPAVVCPVPPAAIVTVPKVGAAEEPV